MLFCYARWGQHTECPFKMLVMFDFTFLHLYTELICNPTSILEEDGSVLSLVPHAVVGYNTLMDRVEGG